MMTVSLQLVLPFRLLCGHITMGALNCIRAGK